MAASAVSPALGTVKSTEDGVALLVVRDLRARLGGGGWKEMARVRKVSFKSRIYIKLNTLHIITNIPVLRIRPQGVSLETHIP